MGCGPSRNINRTSPVTLPPAYQLEASEVDLRGGLDKRRGGISIFDNTKTRFKNLALVQSNFLQNRKNRPKTAEIDVIQWDKYWKKENNSDSESNSNNIDELGANLDESDEDLEIVSIRPTFVQKLDDALKRSSESQTDPVQDESAFDWDLSDRTDTETQTNPPTRATSTNNEGGTAGGGVAPPQEWNDAIVQTDQRLTFLLHRTTEIKWPTKSDHASARGGGVEKGGRVGGGNGRGKTFADAGVQTYIEVQSVGIQVDPLELSEFCGIRRKKSVTPFNFEDASDFSDADISSVHATSAPIGPRGVRPAKSGKTRRLVRNRDGTFCGSPGNSDPDEIIYASEAQIISRSVSPRSGLINPGIDAGFQTNMAVAAVASSNSNNGTSSPVGYASANSGSNNNLPLNNGTVTSKAKSGLLKRTKPKSDVGVQTDEDLSEEAGGFKAEPTTLRKYQIIGKNQDIFNLVDQWVLDVSEKRYKSLKRIVKILVDQIEDEESYEGVEDLIKVRAFYRWLTANIRYTEDCLDKEMSTREILRDKIGVCREYVKIFSEMCNIAGFRVKCIRGYTKGPDFVPGTKFGQGNDPRPHCWNAVYLYGGWRLVDCTWGAGRVNPRTKQFERNLNEHFFLADPEELIYTHFPYNEAEKNYEKWQLLATPVTLDSFNSMPLLNSMFFEHALKLSSDLEMPILAQDSVDVKIKAWEVIRYKYKFFLKDKPESDKYNQYVLCYLKGKNRRQGFFHVTPPEVGDYLLKVYAKPEEDIQHESDTLDHVATFQISAKHIKSKPSPLPRCDLPWGLTQAWYDTEAVILGVKDKPVIKMIGDKSKDVIILTPKDPILSLCHIYDWMGSELVQDKDSDVKYTVLLNKKMQLPVHSPEEGEEQESSLLPFITKTQTPKQVTFTIENPPKEGFFKLQIYARTKPRKKGRFKIPLAANLIVEFRHSNQPKNQPVGIRKSFSGAANLNDSSTLNRSSAKAIISEVVSEQAEETETEIENNDKSETEIQKANEPEPETHPKSTTAEINGLSLVESSS